MRVIVVCVTLSLFGVASALVGCTCYSDMDCDTDECCETPYDPMAASKRLTYASTGTCQKYKICGQTCDHYEQSYGYCGCGPGLYCDTYEKKKTKGMTSVTSIFPARTGYVWVSECKAFSGGK